MGVGEVTKQEQLDPREIAKMLGIGDSTFRKYVVQLEQFNYPFKKDVAGLRIHDEKDVEALQELIKLKNRPGITLYMAASMVASRVNGTGMLEPVTDPILEQAKGVMERKMFLDFQEQVENALLRMQDGIEKRLVEENRALKNEVILMREAVEKKLIVEDNSKKGEVLSKIVEENKALKAQAEETNRLLAELLKQKEEENKKEEITKGESKGFFKKFFS